MPLFETANLSVEATDTIAELWIDVPDRPHNVFTPPLVAELENALTRAEANLAIQALFIRSRKKGSFFAGADIQEFARIQGPSEAIAFSSLGQKLMTRLAAVRMPTIAVIEGVCLGGGLEFALACDYRVVADRPETQLGLPEIELGLIPGWGGTQRLPRVVGLERALQMILQRRRLKARDAHAWGLADALLGDTASTAIRQALGTLSKRPRSGLPRHTWRQTLLETLPLTRQLLFRGAERILRRRVPDEMPAPLEALQAVRVGLKDGIEAGLRYEREAIGRLATSTACRNLVTLFLLTTGARKPEDAADAPPIRKVGVVGAGTMGAGIAQLALLRGFEVVIQEVNDDALAAGMNRLSTLLNQAVERKLLTAEEAHGKLAALGQTTSWEGFQTADLVIEAAIEDLEKKRDIFRLLDQRCRADAVLATNTSALPVGQMQEGLQHPERVAGLHFFNPVHKMPLVEVVRAAATNPTTLARLTRFAAALGKTPVTVGDGPGFVVNRILVPYLNEAGMLLTEGMGVLAIDRVMRKFGMPMGPFELLDQIGLDVAEHVGKAVAPAFGDRLRPNRALEALCRRGWLGVKSGTGFYRYSGKKPAVNMAGIAEVSEELGMPVAVVELTEDRLREARDRMVLPMINEAARCLAEGIAERAETIDIAMVLGTGWAPHRGGPLRYADDRGLAAVVKTLDELAKRHGPRFEPCAELRRRAEAKEKFHA